MVSMAEGEKSVLSGSIPADGIVARLLEIESLRTTGVLAFEDGGTKGEVALVLGQISADQKERDDGEDPVEVLLALTQGRYHVFQRLPPLPVSKGDKTRKEGSLEVHVPADLMNYCERAGLTGMLTLEQDGARAEIGYDGGELDTIRLDNLDDLHEVFGWEEGHFVVETFAAKPEFEEPDELLEDDEDEAADAEADEGEDALPKKSSKPPRPDTTGQQFLRVVEVTLAEVMKEREERRPPTRTSPPLPDMPKPKQHGTLPPPKKKKPRKDPTVRVIYLGADTKVAAPAGAVHVQRGGGRDDALPEASEKRRPSAPDGEPVHPSRKKTRAERPAAKDPVPPRGKKTRAERPAAKPKSGRDTGRRSGQDAGVDSDAETSSLPTAVWALIALILALASLAFLAALPPIE